MGSKYQRFEISPDLESAVAALCEHELHPTAVSGADVLLACTKCNATASRSVTGKASPLEWDEETTPYVELIRVDTFYSFDRSISDPLEGVVGTDSCAVLYSSRRYSDRTGGALRGLTYDQVRTATEEEPDVRDLRANLNLWLEAAESLDFTTGFDAVVEALSAVPRWEELCYFKPDDSYRSAVDLGDVGYGEHDLGYYLGYLRSAEYADEYGSVCHPVLTWLDDTSINGKDPNWKVMACPSRQIMELCLAAAADCVRRVKRHLHRDQNAFEMYLTQVQKEISDLVEVLREKLEEGDDVADLQDLLDAYHVEERSSQDTSFYIILKADEFNKQEAVADEYQAWERGEITDYALEVCRIYTPREFENVQNGPRWGEWEQLEDIDGASGSYVGSDFDSHAQEVVESYLKDHPAYYVGQTYPT